MAERVGFEPTDACASPVFKTGSFNRSDISPYKETVRPLNTCSMIPYPAAVCQQDSTNQV